MDAWLSAKGSGKQPQEVRGPEHVIAQEDERLGGDAAAPVRLAEPVSNLGGKTFDIGADDVADRPDRLAADLDREVGRVRGGHLEKCLRVRARVRVGKSIAQLARHVDVVRVADNGVRVGHPPRSHRATCAL